MTPRPEAWALAGGALAPAAGAPPARPVRCVLGDLPGWEAGGRSGRLLGEAATLLGLASDRCQPSPGPGQVSCDPRVVETAGLGGGMGFTSPLGKPLQGPTLVTASPAGSSEPQPLPLKSGTKHSCPLGNSGDWGLRGSARGPWPSARSLLEVAGACRGVQGRRGGCPHALGLGQHSLL